MSTLTLGTLNLGRAHPGEVRAAMKRVGALGMQEASTSEELMAQLERDGAKVIRPEVRIGQPATPLAYDPEVLRYVRPLSRTAPGGAPPLHPGGRIGPGTGPDDGKPKFLVGGYFLHLESRRRVAVGNLHLYAGQKWGTRTPNKRARISRDMVRQARDVFAGYSGIPFLVGDFNALPVTPTVDALVKDWSCNHAHQRLATHGNWSPDHIWCRDDERVRFVSHRTVPTRGDHDLLVVTYDLTSR